MQQVIADVAGGAARAQVELAVDDERAAHARAEKNADHVARPARGAEPMLAVEAGIHVVGDEHFRLREPLEALAERVAVEECQIGRRAHHALANVDHPRASHADRRHLEAAALGRAEQRLHRLLHVALEVLQAALAGIARQLFFGDDLEAFIEKRVQALGAAHVDADGGASSLLVLSHWGAVTLA